ncbi:hypothetical protein BJX76DRAFT_336165 [Aspergillus varians]
MAREFLSARQRFEDNIRRLSTTVPGYDQLCREIDGSVTVTRIDFADEGYGRPSPSINRNTLSNPERLYQWLAGELDNTTTRYVLVEDFNTDICYTLGATFGIEPQFFLDHMNNQGSRFSPSESDRRMRWNTWNLAKPYLSFHWYRPVSRSKIANSALRRKQIEEHYERVAHKGYEVGKYGGSYDLYTVSVVRAASSILRREWDLPGSKMATEGLVAIEERVSIYETTMNGCQYFIMLLDAVPRAWKATWTKYGSEPQRLIVPPDDTEFEEVLDLYESLVPRFTADISASRIATLNDSQLKAIYETMFSTMECLLKNSDPENQITTTSPGPCRRLPFIQLFRIVLSDTLGLLHLLDAVQSDIVQFTASQDAQIDDILVKRTSIAKLHAQLLPLSRELKRTLKDLLDRGHGESSQYDSIGELRSDFERTIQGFKDVSNAITGTLQFIESHRAIAEAESVTRLTELAFLFIPLSFAASLFSMQIQPLTNPVPVGNFVAFALSLSTATYALRLMARSAWMYQQKQAILNSIRARSSVPPGAPIPNLAIFAWGYARLGPAVGLVLFIACFLVPLFVIIWIRDLDVGLKIALTLLFLVFVSSIVGATFLAVPSLRRQLRRGMQIEWYNTTEEDTRPEAGEPWKRRFAKWAIGKS